MRPVALSDESLSFEDAEEHRIFDRDGIGYGRSKASVRNSIEPQGFDDEEFPEEDIDDLLAIFYIGDDE